MLGEDVEKDIKFMQVLSQYFYLDKTFKGYESISKVPSNFKIFMSLKVLIQCGISDWLFILCGELLNFLNADFKTIPYEY